MTAVTANVNKAAMAGDGRVGDTCALHVMGGWFRGEETTQGGKGKGKGRPRRFRWHRGEEVSMMTWASENGGLGQIVEVLYLNIIIIFLNNRAARPGPGTEHSVTIKQRWCVGRVAGRHVTPSVLCVGAWCVLGCVGVCWGGDNRSATPTYRICCRGDTTSC